MIADGLVNATSLGSGVGDVMASGEVAQGAGGPVYAASIDVEEEFRVRLEEVEVGAAEAGVGPEDDMFVVVQLFSAGIELCAPAHTNRSRSVPTSTGKYRWKQWIRFPIKYCDLSLDTLVCFTLYSSASSEPYGATSSYVFSSRGQIKRSKRRLQIHPDVKADGGEFSTTLGKIRNKSFALKTEKRVVQYNLNELGRVEWLDRVAGAKIAELKRTEDAHREACLVIDFPVFGLPVFNLSVHSPIAGSYQPVPNGGLVTLRDAGIEHAENPCEHKAVKILKFQHLAVDPDLKPNAAQYAKIQAILRLSPLAPPATEDGNLLWHFRFFLSKNKLGFCKFMRCVDWGDVKEEGMARSLISGWGGLTLDDCLELLGGYFKGISPVRNHAVTRLGEESIDTLTGILLQLVQALRYDKDPLNSTLLDLLLTHSAKDWELCSWLYWYATVETHEGNELGAMYKRVCHKITVSIPALFKARLERQVQLMKCLATLQAEISSSSSSRSKKKDKAISIVTDGGCGLKELFSGADHEGAGGGQHGGGFVNFGKSIAASAKSGMAHLTHYNPNTQVSNTSITPHTAAAVLADDEPQPDADCDESLIQPKITSPIFPGIGLGSIVPEDMYLFKSAKMPMAISFNRADSKGQLRLMYKSGDDIRQDQLVMQTITMIDKLLRQDGLDLKLTPYRVLATSVSEGFIGLVPDVVELQDILKNIHGFLKQHNHDPTGEFGLSNECLDNWVKSNAGYAIITFILGIGDRHLENLLVTKDGRILHIDFGFILGKDPKPFPPPLKLRKDMVDAMGGLDSVRYNEFKKLCCSAFNIVRKHSGLIINSLAMMTEANIPDLTADVRSTKDVCARIRSVEAKLRLDLNDSEATNYFLDILNEAINSVFGRLADIVHERVVQLRD